MIVTQYLYVCIVSSISENTLSFRKAVGETFFQNSAMYELNFLIEKTVLYELLMTLNLHFFCRFINSPVFSVHSKKENVGNLGKNSFEK
jgi:hypothetical protein